MIKQEVVTINGKQFRKTYSDTHYILLGKTKYLSAVDPIDIEREYTESDELLPGIPDTQALNIITGGEEV